MTEKELWKAFNKPKEEQKWYYTEMYNAVITNMEEKNALVERYNKILKQLF